MAFIFEPVRYTTKTLDNIMQEKNPKYYLILL